MPLIIITGVPCSGKTTRANQLKEFLESKNKEVVIVSENEEMKKSNLNRNVLYSDSSKEKQIRGLLKSEILKLMTAKNVVIFDGLNYIKGYRYELYCGSKANRNRQCTIHVQINHKEAWNYNENRPEEDRYNAETFDALLMRYEEPDGKNRWDSPLFVTFSDKPLENDRILSSLFDGAPPVPNMSTQNPALNSTNFLYDLDQVTKNITDCLIRSKNMGAQGAIKIDAFPQLAVDISNTSVQQLMILRRQYLTYSKMHPPEPEKIPQIFVQYLNTSL